MPFSACPICLSRRKHRLRECNSKTLWDGKRKARCHRDKEGRIINKDGQSLCNNWNHTVRCKDETARHIHECSGCGSRSHGAQECSLAEKAQSENPA